MTRPGQSERSVAHVPVAVDVERVSVEEVVDPILCRQRAGEALDARLDLWNGDIGKLSEPRAQNADVVPLAVVSDDALPHMLAFVRGRANQRGPDADPVPAGTERGMSPILLGVSDAHPAD